MHTNWRPIGFLAVLLFFISGNLLLAQDGDLQKIKTEKDSIDAVISELKKQLKPLENKSKSLKKRIEILKGWNTGTFGTIGLNQSAFNNWIKGRNEPKFCRRYR